MWTGVREWVRMSDALLEAQDLVKEFRVGGGLALKPRHVHALSGVSDTR